MDVEIVNIVTRMLWIATQLSAPILIVSLVVGTVIGLFQAVVQVQEPTLTFVPKVAAIGATLALTGGWMMSVMTDYFGELMTMAPDLIRL
jgi:flagellar biosynthesis protein FliQ